MLTLCCRSFFFYLTYQNGILRCFTELVNMKFSITNEFKCDVSYVLPQIFLRIQLLDFSMFLFWKHELRGPLICKTIFSFLQWFLICSHGQLRPAAGEASRKYWHSRNTFINAHHLCLIIQVNYLFDLRVGGLTWSCRYMQILPSCILALKTHSIDFFLKKTFYYDSLFITRPFQRQSSVFTD